MTASNAAKTLTRTRDAEYKAPASCYPLLDRLPLCTDFLQPREFRPSAAEKKPMNAMPSANGLGQHVRFARKKRDNAQHERARAYARFFTCGHECHLTGLLQTSSRAISLSGGGTNPPPRGSRIPHGKNSPNANCVRVMHRKLPNKRSGALIDLRWIQSALFPFQVVTAPFVPNGGSDRWP